jgi:hypothetical protein
MAIFLVGEEFGGRDFLYMRRNLEEVSVQMSTSVEEYGFFGGPSEIFERRARSESDSLWTSSISRENSFIPHPFETGGGHVDIRHGDFSRESPS